MQKIFGFFCFLICTVFAFCGISCSNEIVISSDESGVSFSYNAQIGSVFTDMMQAFNLGDDDEPAYFDAAEIRDSLCSVGFTEVSVSASDAERLLISAKLPDTATDPVSKSGIVQTSLAAKSLLVMLSVQTLQDLYQNLPQDFQNMIDMLMSPTFTGDEISDAEYTDLLSSVYGEPFATEISSAKVNFVLVSPMGKRQRFSVPLIRLLNLTEPIKLSA